ncbi:hypothetical protein FHQ26_10600 [Testudinibacter sp. TR-2022]|uniref:MmcQ/YjbR family DNA-binding protein n=1 Tax=Testudinibacter sp. TR-2022 TaxID=2585029 RepID=UPI00111B5F92|nr:MmcQ/YjbR family DNA-binding protein [Testudinibacter sp. TR-2022]TNH03296.1 hypothetical protein FHQ22_08800 [Pasteurellaceae bacterium Phil31]TNH07138.1 hypothetical protein FHQ26_10600 [Testudinibacter sp. TR-2022]TNH08494.1 hypothetical protein FHQ25_09450 [Testudinibacter sp. TR-2022]TNH13653.1 hypothetical protein FIA56_06805 [Testudinibacter sp. TR-2022]TNH18139.1 hypothetical protein FHQ23_05610 [Testudinibacter sp. TR-2022]
MKRTQLIEYIAAQYGAAPDYPWQKHPDYAVFRHPNHKWFCALLRVPGSKLGLADGANVDIVNLKVPPELIGALRSMPGIFPGWHMNKEHWISVLLDGGQNDATIFSLLADSYALSR